MKTKKSVLISFFMIIALCIGLSACNKPEAEIDVWTEAVYAEDVKFGEGEKTVLLEVVAGDKSVTFTINSDKSNLGEVLLEHRLIEGEQGPYGIYVKKVNGITADYDKNQCYWGFYKNGESMMTGVDGTEFKDGEHYEFVYIKS